jgi:hypothetical protein
MIVRTITIPVRVTYGAGKAGAKSAYRVSRWVGFTRLLALAVGVGIGLLAAPTSGAELRQRLQRALDERRAPVGDDAVAERVRYELSHSPRTWHLPQPAVQVTGGVAVLTGETPHETGKAAIERAAAAVPGVASLDSRLVVGPAGNGAAGPST